jgi:hypothetical protein
MQAPKIDDRTYEQIVAQAAALAEQFTRRARPTSAALVGRVLDGDLADPTSGRVYPRGLLIDPAAAQQISQIPGLSAADVVGWRDGGPVAVAATADALVGRVLAQDVADPADPALVIARCGALVDGDLARRIGTAVGAGQVQVQSWPSSQASDLGGALIRMFGRFAEQIVARLNQVPEKNFLAFLNLIGASILPPQPARVPLTFQLAASSPVDTLVPTGTQVAAPPSDGEAEEVVFETERDLVVTRSHLAEAYVREFVGTSNQDLYRRVTAQVAGEVDESFLVFSGEQQIEHALYLACASLLNMPDPADVEIKIDSPDAARLASLLIGWAYQDGDGWRSLPAEAGAPPASGSGVWPIRLKGVPPLSAGQVNGIAGGWLRARLEMPLAPAREAIPLDGMAVGVAAPRDLDLPVYPFGADGLATYFYLSGKDAFGRPYPVVALDLAFSVPGQADDLELRWEINTQDDTWVELGRSGPGRASSRTAGHAFVDETEGFTKRGQVRFQLPPDGSWQISQHQQRFGRWLRVTARGKYTRAPAIASVIAGEAQDLPRIEQVSLGFPGDSPPLPPDQGFTNTLPLDLSKDFWPFGPEPRFNDTFYLAYDIAVGQGYAQAGDRLALNISLRSPGSAAGSPELVWEFWDGAGWQELGCSRSSGQEQKGDVKTYAFKDATNALTKRAAPAITFSLPAQAAPTTVNGQIGYWLRARLVSGNYGVAASYTSKKIPISNTELTVYELVEASFNPPIVQSLSFTVSRSAAIALSACLSYNDFHYADHTAANNAPGVLFAPFQPTIDRDPAFYLGFDQPFDQRVVTLYAQVSPPDPHDVTRAAIEAATTNSAPQVAWEYATGPGDAWAPLDAIDETNTFANCGLIQLVGPPDFASRMLFGQRLYWLRARWHEGQFAVRPRLQQLLINTTWASQATTIQNEILGSGNGNPAQTFRLAQAPVLSGARVEVREPQLPSADEQSAIERLEGQDAIGISLDAAGQPEEIWVRWHAVPDFHGSGPRDRHYTLDQISGEIRFGDGQYGLIPPVGQNNIRAARYRSGGGAQGNRPAGTVVQLKSSVPYVDSVTNRESAFGGAPRQSLESVKRYGTRQLRHGGRVVTAEDLEDLAYAASSDVARAHAIAPRFRPLDLWLDPQTAPAAGTCQEINDAGVMGLILVPQSDSPRPTPSVGLLEQVKAFILARCPATADLWVAGPDWIEVTVRVTIVPTSLALADTIGGRVALALERFLHPLLGGPRGDGWAFGRVPYRSDLYALIEGIAGVDHIRDLRVDKQSESDVSPQRALIFSGRHQVRLALRPQ